MCREAGHYCQVRVTTCPSLSCDKFARILLKDFSQRYVARAKIAIILLRRKSWDTFFAENLCFYVAQHVFMVTKLCRMAEKGADEGKKKSYEIENSTKLDLFGTDIWMGR